MNIKYLQNKLNNNTFNLKLYKTIPIIILDQIDNQEVNINSVVKDIEKHFPYGKLLVNDIDNIYIGNFDFLYNKQFTALSDNGTIYVSNVQFSNFSMLCDIIHEFSHIIEQKFNQEIYGDNSLESEFLVFRTKLYHKIKQWAEEHENFNITNKLDKLLFINPEFNEDFDNLLFRIIGYQNIAYLTAGIFLKPYSATSVSEYFSTGFEQMFIFNKNFEKSNYVLYNKLQEIEQLLKKSL